MADSRERADEALAVALAAGRRVEEAASIAGVSPRTASRRLREPGFTGRVRELRAEMTAAAVGRLAECCSAASDRLAELVCSGDGHLAFKAAKAVLELTFKAQELSELERRIGDLELALEGRNHE
jgi:hypothetical protein